MSTEMATSQSAVRLSKSLKFLTPREIYLIDELLESIGDFGEVHLVVKAGRLRFASRVESLDALKYDRPEH